MTLPHNIQICEAAYTLRRATATYRRKCINIHSVSKKTRQRKSAKQKRVSGKTHQSRINIHVLVRNLPLFIAEKALPHHRKTFSATPQRLFRHTERAFPQARKASLAEGENLFCGVIWHKQLCVSALTNRCKTRVFTAVNCHARKKRSITELSPHKYAYAGRI